MELLKEGARVFGLHLTPEHLAAFRTYYHELVIWNERLNLTTVTEYRAVQYKHFLDSLSCLLAFPYPSVATPMVEVIPISHRPYQPLCCVDVGTGAGFPGIPLKILRPEMHLTLVEATGKKARFLQHLVGKLGMNDVEIVPSRAEDLGQDVRYRERYDVVLARAVAVLSVLVEYCLPLCKVEGRLIAQKGGNIEEEEIPRAKTAIDLLGGEIRCVKLLTLPGLQEERSLVVIEKIAPTSHKYPRRPGVPLKRPIR